MINKSIATFVRARQIVAANDTCYDLVVPHYNMKGGIFCDKSLTRRDMTLV